MEASTELLSKKATARFAGLSVSTVNRLRGDPTSGFPLPIAVRGKVLFFRNEIKAWLESQPRTQRMTTRGGQGSA